MILRRIVIVALAGGVFLAYSALRQEVARSSAATDDLGAVPEFSFVDQDGAPKRLADFFGKPWVASFIFARCHDECPLIVSRMKELRPKLPPELRLASVSVDPNDKPADLKRFAKSQGADWSFMVGEPAEVERFARGLKLGLGGKGPEEGALIHSNRLVLIDPQGRIRGYYDPEEETDARRLVIDAARPNGARHYVHLLRSLIAYSAISERNK